MIQELVKRSMVGVVIAFTALTVASCIADEELLPGGGSEPEDGTVKLELFTRTPDYAKPDTRAGMAQENAVGNTPWVLVFKLSGSNYYYAEAAQAYVMAGKSFVNLTATTVDTRLLILANSQDKFTNAAGTEYDYTTANFNTLLAGQTLAGASILLHTKSLASPQQTVPFASKTTANQQPLPMSGVYSATGGIGKNMSVGTQTTPFELSRAVAKVVVENDDAAFKLIAATVISTPKRGRLYQNDATLKSNTASERTNYLSATAGSEVINIASANNTNSTATSPLYVYESAKGDAAHTHVIVQGEFRGRMYFYKLAFRDPAATAANPNTTLDVLRNSTYTFNITAVKREGFSTVADAMAAAHSSNEEIVWQINVTDDYAHDIIDNGEYYLGFTNSQYIVYGDGAQTDKVAFTVTTNRLTAAPLETNFIECSGAGLTLTTSNQKVGLAASATAPGVTDVKINLTAAFTSGTVTVRLGDLVKEITIEKRPALNGAIPFEELAGDYIAAEIESGADWLKLSTDGQNEQINPVNIPAGGNTYIHPALNYGPTGTVKNGGVVYLSRIDESAGRTKIALSQNVAQFALPTGTTTLPASYVGTFHRASEMGERNIRVPAKTGGKWIAKVMVGEEFIHIADGLGAGWPTGTNDAEANLVPGEEQYIWGIATVEGEIRFRVGLKSKLSNAKPDNTTPPRYGKILVSHDNGAKYYEIYVRQGEAADYVMRNEDPVSGALSQRTITAEFSPYNLTAAQLNKPTRATYSPNAALLAGYDNPTLFTEYPSQAGAFFQHLPLVNFRYAWDGHSTTLPISWDDNYVSDIWDRRKADNETCPIGYRRPNDGVTNAYGGGTVASSEMRQSLMQTPGASINVANGNVADGYYADGFFDRHAIEPSPESKAVLCTVRSGTDEAAYRGFLSYNPYNCASLFFPMSGTRDTYTGALQVRGTFGLYLSSSAGSPGTVWYMLLQGVSVEIGSYSNKSGASIRCVKDQSLAPPTETLYPKLIHASPGMVGIKQSDMMALLNGTKTLGDGSYKPTLRGSNIYKGTVVDNAATQTEFGGLEAEPVYLLYFKWGSMIGMVGDDVMGAAYSTDVVMWVNDDFTGTGNLASYAGFAAAGSTLTMTNDAIKLTPGRGQGDVCAEITGGDYHIPGGIPTWNGWSTASGKYVVGTSYNPPIVTNTGSRLSAGILSNDNTIFVPASGQRMQTSGEMMWFTNGQAFAWSSTAVSSSGGARLMGMNGGSAIEVGTNTSTPKDSALPVRCVRN